MELEPSDLSSAAEWVLDISSRVLDERWNAAVLDAWSPRRTLDHLVDPAARGVARHPRSHPAVRRSHPGRGGRGTGGSTALTRHRVLAVATPLPGDGEQNIGHRATSASHEDPAFRSPRAAGQPHRTRARNPGRPTAGSRGWNAARLPDRSVVASSRITGTHITSPHSMPPCSKRSGSAEPSSITEVAIPSISTEGTERPASTRVRVVLTAPRLQERHVSRNTPGIVTVGGIAARHADLRIRLTSLEGTEQIQ